MIAHFRDLGNQKIQVGTDFKEWVDFYFLSLTNMSSHFRMTKLKGFKR